jgi:cation:H+ antiporter
MVVALLVLNRRPAQGLEVLLASSVSQWTLGLGSLPIAYLAGGGGVSLPMAGREQLELGVTMSVALFAVAALATFQPTRVDALLIAVVFAIRLAYPTSFIRLASALVLLVFAIDLLAARWRQVGLVTAAVLRPMRPARQERHDDQRRTGWRDA